MPMAVREMRELPSLCSVCNRAPVCERRRHDGMIMWYCEECDTYSEPQSEIPSNPKEPAQEPESADKLMGLCVMCERRGYCGKAKKVGGVWHCEEYL